MISRELKQRIYSLPSYLLLHVFKEASLPSFFTTQRTLTCFEHPAIQLFKQYLSIMKACLIASVVAILSFGAVATPRPKPVISEGVTPRGELTLASVNDVNAGPCNWRCAAIPGIGPVVVCTCTSDGVPTSCCDSDCIQTCS